MGKQLAKDCKISVLLDRTLVNSILSALQCFVGTDDNNEYYDNAEKLQETISKFSFVRKGKGDDEDTVVVSLYEREAAALVSILAVYIFARDGEPDDLLAELQQKFRKKGLGNSQLRSSENHAD